MTETPIYDELLIEQELHEEHPCDGTGWQEHCGNPADLFIRYECGHIRHRCHDCYAEQAFYELTRGSLLCWNCGTRTHTASVEPIKRE